MNIYVKIFLIEVLCFALIFGSGMYAFDKYYVDNSEDLTEERIAGLTMDDRENNENDLENDEDEDDEVEIVEKKSKLELLIEESNRLNILVFGTDGGRA